MMEDPVHDVKTECEDDEDVEKKETLKEEIKRPRRGRSSAKDNSKAKDNGETSNNVDEIKTEPPDDYNEQSRTNVSVEDEESGSDSDATVDEELANLPASIAANIEAFKRMMSPEVQAAMLAGNFFLPQPFMGLDPEATAMMAEKLASMRDDKALDKSLNSTFSDNGSVKSGSDVDCMKSYYKNHTPPPHLDDGDDADDTEDSKSDTSEEETAENNGKEEVGDESEDEELAYYTCGEKDGSSNKQKCLLVFNSKDMLMYHKTSCHGTPCKVCGIKIYPLNYMKQHTKEAHPWMDEAQSDEDNDINEDRTEPSDSNANNDDTTSSADQEGGDKSGHLCTICNQTFTSRSTMTAHKSSAHGSPCLLCGKRFLTARYMKTHMREAHPEELEKLPKPKGGAKKSKKAAKSKLPDVPLDIVFPDPETLPDDFPIKQYKAPRRKEVDIPTKIEAITALQEEALKLQGAFEAAAKLVADYADDPDSIHRDSDGNPECRLCHKKFSSFKALKIHVKDIHIAARNYSCEQCNQTFKRKGDLKSHMNKHLQPRSFKCYLCDETFNWQGNLTTHFKRKHSDEKSYICPICNRGFSCSSGLKEHLNTHTDARPFLCDLCGSTFKSKSAHRRHMLKLHSVGTKESLAKVKEKNSNAAKMHACPHCPKKFRFISELHQHVGEKEPHVCKVCQRQCACKTQFKSHMQVNHRHTSTKSAEFKCDFCHREFWKKCNLVQHINKMHSKGEYMCVRCDAVFESEAELVHHKQNEHNAQVFPCVECGSEFHSHERLNLHMKSEHGMSVEIDEHEQVLIVTKDDKDDDDDEDTDTEMDTSGHDAGLSESNNSLEMDNSFDKSGSDKSPVATMPLLLSKLWGNSMDKPGANKKKRVISLLQNRLQCPVCKKVFRYNGYHYRRHLKRHKDEKKHEVTTNTNKTTKKKVYKTCEYCGKIFLSKVHYTSHMEEIHPDKSLVCKYCGKQFTKMFHMKFHIVKHETKASSFSCEVCGKTYPHLSRLQRHMNAHTDEKRHPCQYCGKMFKFPEGVTQHIKNTHHDSGPYSCDICGRLLKTQGNLRKHMELHFQGKPFLCEYCGKGFARARNRRLHISRLHPEALDDYLAKNSKNSTVKTVKAEPLELADPAESAEPVEPVDLADPAGPVDEDSELTE